MDGEKSKNKNYIAKRVLFVLLLFLWVCALSIYILLGKRPSAQQTHSLPLPSLPLSISPSPFPTSGLRVNGFEVIDTKLGLHIDTSKTTFIAKGQSPIEQDYGARIDLQWLGAEIAGGKFYDTNGKMLDYREVAKAYRYSEETKGINISETTYRGLPAVYTEVTINNLPHQYFQPYAFIAVQKSALVYVFLAENKENLNQLLDATTFYDSNLLENRTIESVTAPTKGKILFPQRTAPPITSSKPTFMVKLTQGQEQFLPATFELKGLAYNKELFKFQLFFEASNAQNVTAYIDGKQNKNIHGFPQFPSVTCEIQHNSANYGFYDDPLFYAESRNIEPILTMEDCITYRAQDVSPAILMFTPDSPLSEGKHTLVVKSAGGYMLSTSFTINSNYMQALQPLPTTGDITEYNPFETLDGTDNCMPGYYFEPNYLRVPLPKKYTKALSYELHFPQRGEEKKSYSEDRRVHMKFDNTLYPLSFPDSPTFYFPEEKNYIDGHEYLPTEKALYVPQDRLYFGNGVKASLLTEEGYNASTYHELYPLDNSGHRYSQSPLPWTTSGWSGCDG